MASRLHRSVACLAIVSAAPALQSCAAVLGSKTAEVSAISEPPGAEVYLDGNRLGTTPVTLHLAHKRSHTLLFKRAGHRDATCVLQSSTQAGWVILDVLFGLVPIIIDAATGDWNQIGNKRCTVTLPAEPGAPQVAASRPAPPSTPAAKSPAFQSSAPDEPVPDEVRVARRLVVGDMLRLGVVAAVEQGPRGIVRAAVGEAFHASPGRERLFARLSQHYGTWTTEGAPVVVELWEGGEKIGEFTEETFYIGPRYATPIDCAGPGSAGICGYGPVDAPAPPSAASPEPMPAPAPRPSGGGTVGHGGFHAGLGIGGGSADLVCDGCDFASQTGLSGFLFLGGAVGANTVLGVESTGWIHRNDFGFDAQVYSLMLAATGYLNESSGLFLTTGLGLVGYREESDFGTLRANGFGFSGRLGYEIRAGGGGLLLVPYLGFLSTIGGADFDFDGTRVGEFDINNLQFGLALGLN